MVECRSDAEGTRLRAKLPRDNTLPDPLNLQLTVLSSDGPCDDNSGGSFVGLGQRWELNPKAPAHADSLMKLEVFKKE